MGMKSEDKVPRNWHGPCRRCGVQLRPPRTLVRDWGPSKVHSYQGMDYACYMATRAEIAQAERIRAASEGENSSEPRDPYRWRKDLRSEEVAVLVQIRDRFGRSSDARELSIALGFLTLEGVSPTVVGDYVAMQH